jgi:hypothetical protein
MASIALGFGAVALAVYGARTTTTTMGRFVEAHIGKPALVRETSRLGWRTAATSIVNPAQAARRFLTRPKDIFDGIVFPQDLHARLAWYGRWRPSWWRTFCGGMDRRVWGSVGCLSEPFVSFSRITERSGGACL